METIRDFEDVLVLMDKHKVRYLIVGGLAFIYYAKPRYTKDIDLWIDSTPGNIERANAALAEFGSPWLLDADRENEFVQVGVAPNRVDLIRRIEGLTFEEAWKRREQGPYGKAKPNWIDLDDLILIKKRIKVSRHQQDVEHLLKVREMRRARKKKRRRPSTRLRAGGGTKA